MVAVDDRVLDRLCVFPDYRRFKQHVTGKQVWPSWYRHCKCFFCTYHFTFFYINVDFSFYSFQNKKERKEIASGLTVFNRADQ